MEPLMIIVILLEVVIGLALVVMINNYQKSQEREFIKKTNREMMDCKKIIEDFEKSN